MPKPLRTLFIIADGSRARWVRRAEGADDFVTGKELKADPRPHEEPHGVVFESSSGRGFNVEEKSAAVRKHQARFAEEVAEAINAEAASNELDRLALVAPARTLAAIDKHLSAKARAKIVKTLAKDLTKTPDHELMGWLRGLELD